MVLTSPNMFQLVLTECPLEAAGNSVKLKELRAVNKACGKSSMRLTKSSELNWVRAKAVKCTKKCKQVQAPTRSLPEIFAQLCDIAVPKEQGEASVHVRRPFGICRRPRG
ncbi:unnamed protein product [Symbiodinium natans]|uniref:Uncharacterized protein n=1 Tax=Symbiodinium natans TaxID=878477 RepID=A0A812SR89_9DINO|nr:unnamed protein product [Symbiodinium natans]